MAALFVIKNNNKKTKTKIEELRCPSIDEWIFKIWFVYTMKYYSVKQRNYRKTK